MSIDKLINDLTKILEIKKKFNIDVRDCLDVILYVYHTSIVCLPNVMNEAAVIVSYNLAIFSLSKCIAVCEIISWEIVSEKEKKNDY